MWYSVSCSWLICQLHKVAVAMVVFVEQMDLRSSNSFLFTLNGKHPAFQKYQGSQIIQLVVLLLAAVQTEARNGQQILGHHLKMVLNPRFPWDMMIIEMALDFLTVEVLRQTKILSPQKLHQKQLIQLDKTAEANVQWIRLLIHVSLFWQLPIGPSLFSFVFKFDFIILLLLY